MRVISVWPGALDVNQIGARFVQNTRGFDFGGAAARVPFYARFERARVPALRSARKRYAMERQIFKLFVRGQVRAASVA